MRELNELVDLLEHGKAEKLVLTKSGEMPAVVISVELFGRLARGASTTKLQAA
jgi:hypothetical protein